MACPDGEASYRDGQGGSSRNGSGRSCAAGGGGQSRLADQRGMKASAPTGQPRADLIAVSVWTGAHSRVGALLGGSVTGAGAPQPSEHRTGSSRRRTSSAPPAEGCPEPSGRPAGRGASAGRALLGPGRVRFVPGHLVGEGPQRDAAPLRPVLLCPGHPRRPLPAVCPRVDGFLAALAAAPALRPRGSKSSGRVPRSPGTPPALRGVVRGGGCSGRRFNFD